MNGRVDWRHASDVVREAAKKVAEDALSDMFDQFTHDGSSLAMECRPGMYDLQEDGKGGLWIVCGQDVELHVDASGEQDGAYRDPQEMWNDFEPQDGGW